MAARLGSLSCPGPSCCCCCCCCCSGGALLPVARIEVGPVPPGSGGRCCDGDGVASAAAGPSPGTGMGAGAAGAAGADACCCSDTCCCLAIPAAALRKLMAFSIFSGSWRIIIPTRELAGAWMAAFAPCVCCCMAQAAPDCMLWGMRGVGGLLLPPRLAKSMGVGSCWGDETF